MNVYAEKQSNFWGAPYMVEEVFFDEKLFFHHFFLVLFELRSNWRVPPNLICPFLWRKEKN